MLSATCSRPRSLIQASLVILFATLGCKASTEGQLDRPSYAWNQEGDFCGNTVVVDGEAGVWTEGGCEGSSGLASQGTVTQEKLAHIQAAFEAHPDPAAYQEGCADHGTGNTSVRFTERRLDGTVREWRLCVGDDGSGRGYPPPFNETAQAFRE